MTEITLMPSPHAEGAKALIDRIRALRAEIPRFNGTVTVDGRRLAARLAVSDQFMEAASVAVQTSDRLAQAAGVDASTLRDSFRFAISYGAIVRELEALARDVAGSIRLQRAEAAASALDVYAIAQRLNMQKDGAELQRHVEAMRGEAAPQTTAADGFRAHPSGSVVPEGRSAGPPLFSITFPE